MSALLLFQMVTTLALAGLIWTVQIVHYPLFGWVGESGFAAFHAEHSRRIAWLVVPLMAAELGGAVALVAARPTLVPVWAAWLGLVLVGVVWCTTALLSVPQHRRLAGGFEPRAHACLVGSNWIRTAAWTTRAGLLVWLAARGSG